MPEPRFTDGRQTFLEMLARGHTSAAYRIGLNARWLPTLAGETVPDAENPDGYAIRADAIAAAKRYRDSCREELAGAANGSL